MNKREAKKFALGVAAAMVNREHYSPSDLTAELPDDDFDRVISALDEIAASLEKRAAR